MTLMNELFEQKELTQSDCHNKQNFNNSEEVITCSTNNVENKITQPLYSFTHTKDNYQINIKEEFGKKTNFTSQLYNISSAKYNSFYNWNLNNV